MRGFAREALVTIVSMVVIVYTLSFLTARQPAKALAIEPTAASSIPADAVVFYGSVTDRLTGKPVRGANIAISKVLAGASLQRVAAVSTAADGRFRVQLSGARAGTYRLVFEANLTTGVVRDAYDLRASPGMAYGLRAVLINKDYFLLLPFPGY